MYIDAKIINKLVHVTERDTNGIRSVKHYTPVYSCYYPDLDGEHTSIFGETLQKHTSTKAYEFYDDVKYLQNELSVTTYESDTKVLFDVLESKYPTSDSPKLNISVFDIEVDKDPELGFSTIANPYAPITAVTLHNKWSDECITLLVPPENLTMDECRQLLDGVLFQAPDGTLTTTKQNGDTFGVMAESDGYFVVRDEEQLLRVMLDQWIDADVLSGWNSSIYDIPYIIQRIRIVLGGETIDQLQITDDYNQDIVSQESQQWLQKLCLFPCAPTVRYIERYGNTEKTYALHGRIHLDYLDLYRKFTYEELHSYALDFVLEHEVDQNKIPYDGSLDQLYRWDFRRFSAYSRQDVTGLSDVDDKLKFIDLANSMAHLAGVTIDKVLGSVVMIEQAILKELHQQNLVCFDRSEKTRNYPIPGAFVLEPTKGMYNWIASYDFNSLYPTVIRMLNISPETIVGWVIPTETLELLTKYMTVDKLEGAAAWAKIHGTIEYNRVIEESDEEVVFAIEHEFYEDADGLPIPATVTLTGKELHDQIRENNWVITAFGLVLHRQTQGIIPYCLEKWYNQRVEYKTKQKAAYKKSLETGGDEKTKWIAEEAYYDKLQLIQKIFLNSLYGALLNEHCRFYDPRMGASVTMSGRVCLSELVDLTEHLLDTEILHDE